MSTIGIISSRISSTAAFRRRFLFRFIQVKPALFASTVANHNVPPRLSSPTNTTPKVIAITEYVKLAALGFDSSSGDNSSSLLSSLWSNEEKGESANSQKVKLLDKRASAKLLRLVEAKRQVEQTRMELKHARNNELLLDQLKKDNEALALAYAQAIHYVARTKQSNAGETAHSLLDEWLDRTGAPKPKEKNQQLLPLSSLFLCSSSATTNTPKLPQLSIYLNPPTLKSFHHVLYAYALQNCKLTDKYLKSEQVIQRMAELHLWYPENFTPPNNTTLLLVTKCFSNATSNPQNKKKSGASTIILQRMKYFHSIISTHSDLETRLTFLLHALKSKALQSSLHGTEESQLCQKWLDELSATFLQYQEQTQSNNTSEMNRTETLMEQTTDEEEEDEDTKKDFSMELIINCYLSVLRGYVRASRVPHPNNNSCLDALAVLRKMQKVLSIQEENNYATILTHAYDLVLTSCANCKQPRLAVALYQEVQRPTENTFLFTIQSFSHGNRNEYSSDLDFILKDLSNKYISGELAPATTAVYNALLELYCKWYRRNGSSAIHEEDEGDRTPFLLNIVHQQLEKMEDMAFRHEGLIGLQPDFTSLTLLLKACSMMGITLNNQNTANVNYHQQHQQRKKALELAHTTFQKLTDMDKEEETPKMTDDSYYYYMKCILTLSPTAVKPVEDDSVIAVKEEDIKSTNNDTSKTIKSLFLQCCKKGLVNKNVLDVLRKSTTPDEYKKMVGEGRLPNQWIENVTSINALYTNGRTTNAAVTTPSKHLVTSSIKRKVSSAGTKSHHDTSSRNLSKNEPSDGKNIKDDQKRRHYYASKVKKSGWSPKTNSDNMPSKSGRRQGVK